MGAAVKLTTRARFATICIHAGQEPDSATGAIITTKILYEMEREDHKLALVSLCIGGGEATALAIERL